MKMVHAAIKVFESVKAAIVLEWPFLFVSLQRAKSKEEKRLRNLDVKQFASTTAGLLQMVLPRLFCHQKVVQKLKQNHRELSASKYGITAAEHN